MNLSKRFFVLNAVATTVTILITALAVMVFIAAYSRVFKGDAGMNDLKRMVEVRAGFGEIKKETLVMEPEDITRAHYHRTVAQTVKSLGAEAIILKNREVLFATKDFGRIEIERCLAFSQSNSDNTSLELEDRTYILDRVDIRLKNGDNGILLLLAPIKLKTNFYRTLAIFTTLLFILAFLGINLWVSMIFSRGVITPVSRLKTAAGRISAGDLNYEIVEEGEGEVKELCRALEQMRIKLKESVFLQKKYDENRRFLISSISHDLKTPMTSIKGYIEGILDGVAKKPEKVSDYLETARAKTILVNSMIDDLLLYSKLDLNQIPFNFERINLSEFFMYCVEDNQYEFEHANIKLSLQNELGEAVFVLIDQERFKRVVQNILDNAKKYISRPDGEVKVILRETRTSAVIEIKDNGKGISEQDLPHIFDRFYRADASRRSTDGSGLGLAIAKQIVEGHEGRIWAVSNKSEGTGMIISLKKQ